MNPSDKKALLEKLEANHLIYKELSFSGRTIIIHETTGHSSRRLGAMSVQLEQDTSVGEDEKNALFTLYIPLMVCSAGDLPQSYDDFFWMKNSDIEEWTQAARKMNPQLFSLLDFQEKRLDKYMSDQELSKKKKRRSGSK
jgi:hypothetical protein